MAGKFECYKDKSGEFRFRLKARNGKTLLSSEGYKSKSAAVNGIKAVKKNAEVPGRFSLKSTVAGRFRFNLTANNGQVIGSSHPYTRKYSAKKGISLVANTATKAIAFDLTDAGTGSTGPGIRPIEI